MCLAFKTLKPWVKRTIVVLSTVFLIALYLFIMQVILMATQRRFLDTMEYGFARSVFISVAYIITVVTLLFYILWMFVENGTDDLSVFIFAVVAGILCLVGCIFSMVLCLGRISQWHSNPAIFNAVTVSNLFILAAMTILLLIGLVKVSVFFLNYASNKIASRYESYV